MTFLSPLLLWGLPLILLPVLIHLFNRLRYRPMNWGAMMFLRMATRKSTRYAKLRQYLILLFRCLAVAALLMAIARPLVGGWAGWMVSSRPDVILILLDRSASMEDKNGGTLVTKRETALKTLANTAKAYSESSRVLLLDHTGKHPKEIANLNDISTVPTTAATDTAADVPAMLQAAIDWIIEAKPGNTEIWLASDLQQSNWHPEAQARWGAMREGMLNLPQNIRVRLLAMNEPTESNVSVTIEEINRQQRGNSAELELVLKLERKETVVQDAFPIDFYFNDVPTGERVTVKFEGQTMRYRRRMTLPAADSGGWGHVQLPDDSNARDNRAYFVYGQQELTSVAVVGSDPIARRVLQIAASPDPASTNVVAEVILNDKLGDANWSKYAAVLWQSKPPEGDMAAKLQVYVNSGGILIFFPSGETGSFEGLGWGEVQTAAVNESFKVSRWETGEGPLANTAEGTQLPMEDLEIIKRQVISSESTVLARYSDNTPLVVRQIMGRGQALMCGTLPLEEWSSLTEGFVLVPMIQRLVSAGASRLTAARQLVCGEATTGDRGQRWIPIGNNSGTEFGSQSGIYRSDDRVVAQNRPVHEDDWVSMEPTKARELFGKVPVQLFEEKESGAPKLQSEIWRILLAFMALFLIVESILILPKQSEESSTLAAPSERLAT
ncbi:MAG: hypothetical protein JW388_0119 [Nitrospira sp.]|nr:hypothetical protein [Nitrospira sp.]